MAIEYGTVLTTATNSQLMGNVTNGIGGMLPAGIPGISTGGGSAGAAVSGGGNVYHGDVKGGINPFLFVGSLIFVAIIAFKVTRK